MPYMRYDFTSRRVPMEMAPSGPGALCNHAEISRDPVAFMCFYGGGRRRADVQAGCIRYDFTSRRVTMEMAPSGYGVICTSAESSIDRVASKSFELLQRTGQKTVQTGRSRPLGDTCVYWSCIFTAIGPSKPLQRTGQKTVQIGCSPSQAWRIAIACKQARDASKYSLG
jgi:hypothetical protein